MKSNSGNLIPIELGASGVDAETQRNGTATGAFIDAKTDCVVPLILKDAARKRKLASNPAIRALQSELRSRKSYFKNTGYGN